MMEAVKEACATKPWRKVQAGGSELDATAGWR